MLIKITLTIHFSPIRMAKMKDYSTHNSSLYVLNEYSFLCVWNGTLLQIPSETYSVIFQLKGKGLNGYCGIIPLEGGKYFAIANVDTISIIKPCYE